MVCGGGQAPGYHRVAADSGHIDDEVLEVRVDVSVNWDLTSARLDAAANDFEAIPAASVVSYRSYELCN